MDFDALDSGDINSGDSDADETGGTPIPLKRLSAPIRSRKARGANPKTRRKDERFMADLIDRGGLAGLSIGTRLPEINPESKLRQANPQLAT